MQEEPNRGLRFSRRSSPEGALLFSETTDVRAAARRLRSKIHLRMGTGEIIGIKAEEAIAVADSWDAFERRIKSSGAEPAASADAFGAAEPPAVRRTGHSVAESNDLTSWR
jgi:hypothetical protein